MLFLHAQLSEMLGFSFFSLSSKYCQSKYFIWWHSFGRSALRVPIKWTSCLSFSKNLPYSVFMPFRCRNIWAGDNNKSIERPLIDRQTLRRRSRRSKHVEERTFGKVLATNAYALAHLKPIAVIHVAFFHSLPLSLGSLLLCSSSEQVFAVSFSDTQNNCYLWLKQFHLLR